MLLRVVVAFALLLSGSTVYGQFGARVGYTSLGSASNSEASPSPIAGYHLGLNYWYRLKDYRVEFFPEVTYQNAFDRGQARDLIDQSNQFGVVIPVQIYPFDLISDCSCPTFSKQSRVFQKGFFLFGSGGYLWGKSNSPLAGAGAGFDYGLNDLITISFLAEYRHYFRDSSIALPLDRSWLFGLRASFRPDYKRGF